MFIRSHFLNPDPPAGGGTGDPPESRAQKTNTLIDRLVRTHGSAEGALAVLAAQNVTLEEESTARGREITALKAKVPDPEKMVVLPKERAELLNKFEAL